MDDYGIKVSAEDIDAKEAAARDLLLSTQYPHAKLDVTKDISFRNIVLSFLNDPPEPAGTPGNETLKTLVYSFRHTYTYVPSTFHLVNLITPPTVAVFYQTYFQDAGVIAARTAFDGAEFKIETTEKFINMYVEKYKDNAFGGLANNLAGVRLRIRSYVFVEDIGV